MIEANTSLVWRFVETFIYIAYAFSVILILIGGLFSIFLILRDIYRTTGTKVIMAEATKSFGKKIVIGAVVVTIFEYVLRIFGILPR
jgi:uncharacterized membrane protein